MYQGTTPTHVFTLPFDVSKIKELKITYEQSGKEVLSKKKADCTLDGKTATVVLTQDDTFKFEQYTPLNIQVRVLTMNGEALSSDIITVQVSRALDSEVLE